MKPLLDMIAAACPYLMFDDILCRFLARCIGLMRYVGLVTHDRISTDLLFLRRTLWSIWVNTLLSHQFTHLQLDC